MHVGLAAVFQNPGKARSDLDVYQNELRLVSQAEGLGFDSIWGVEHHFTDYTMCPDVLQYLTYFAGKTEKVNLGSMVVVLPWHDPIRVVEQISMLDNMSGGRMILGLGRGLGRIEFGGFRIPMEESRGRFIESAKMILEGLETGYCEFDGEYIKQPRREIRPRPSKSFKGRTYAAAVSPESARIMAELGVGILIIPQKPWDMVAAELEEYATIFREVNGEEPPKPWASGWVFCDEDEDRAREMARRYIGGYWNTVIDHYEFKSDHFKKIKGYESYSVMQERVSEEGGAEKMVEFFLNLQVWGTPDQCTAKIVDICDRIGSDSFNGVFSYAGMPWDEAERNMSLFASDVLPRLQALPASGERLRVAASA